MKIAIHHIQDSFSEGWILYCKENNINYKLVNAYESNIIEQVADCDVFMWHYRQHDYKDMLAAKSILFAIEQSGKKVFPNFNSAWHFDDKVAQKYLLEAIGAPLVPSWVFYDKSTAKKWANNTNYPKVFKLTGGASAINVKLVHNRKQCLALIDKAFSNGFKQNDYLYQFKDRLKKFKDNKIKFYQIFSPLYHIVKPTLFDKMSNNEKGYVYFQEFIPNNDSDIRVIVIDRKAFAIKRMVRENDFRASGSGKILYDINLIDLRCISIALETSLKLNAQSLAYDFIFDNNNCPKLIEISYGFLLKAYDNCEGYWDENLNFIKAEINSSKWIIEQFLE